MEKIVIKDSYFEGSGDDLLNVHGIHFKITDIEGKNITVRFMHPQTHGFNPLRSGDTIAYINPETLLEEGSAEIEKSELLNEYEIRLSVSSTKNAVVGKVIEDITACPDLEFTGSISSKIITRGLLITTRGKVNVEGNRFLSSSMSGVLLSDDAKKAGMKAVCAKMSRLKITYSITAAKRLFSSNRKTAVMMALFIRTSKFAATHSEITAAPVLK